MQAAKVISIIVGILMTILGIIFLVRPGATFRTLILILGIVLIVSAISSFVNFFSATKSGYTNVWTILGAILSLIAGILLITNHFAGFFAGTFILYFLAALVLIKGIFQVIEALSSRSFNGGLGGGSAAMLVIGLLLIVAGIICFINPGLLEAFISVAVSFFLIICGVSLLAGGLSLPSV